MNIENHNSRLKLKNVASITVPGLREEGTEWRHCKGRLVSGQTPEHFLGAFPLTAAASVSGYRPFLLSLVCVLGSEGVRWQGATVSANSRFPGL